MIIRIREWFEIRRRAHNSLMEPPGRAVFYVSITFIGMYLWFVCC